MHTKPYIQSEKKSDVIKKAFVTAFPYTDTDLCRFLVSGADLWNLHECLRIQLLVSDAYEHHHLCGFGGICGGKPAAGSV